MTSVQTSISTSLNGGAPPAVAPRQTRAFPHRAETTTSSVRVREPSAEATSPAPTAAQHHGALVLLGLDEQGRPHASRFAVGDEEQVRAAGATMQFSVLAVVGEPMAELVAKLPTGKVFTSGKAFVPFAKQELFDRLVAYLPIRERPVRRATAAAKSKTAKPKAADSAALEQNGADGRAAVSANAYAAVRNGATFKPSVLPGGFDQIKIGSVVLASESRDDGWWTAIVLEDHGDGLFLIRWEDFEDIDPFFRRPEQLALMHPSFKGE